MHSNKYVHLDIKPGNIMIDDKFDLKLCDFGTSQLMRDKVELRGLTGTKLYASPEI